jgi:hypothetical protein
VTWESTIVSSSAVHSGAKSAAGIDEAHRVERAQTIDEIRLGNDSEVVEARGTLCGHPVIRSKRQLSGEISD